MIKLYGTIRVQRLAGKVFRIGSDGAGGLLQDKTVYPSHSEQIITPDDDFYGLSLVTVKPTPRLPALAVSMGEGVGDIPYGEVVGHDVLDGIWQSITAEDVTEEVTE